VRSSPIRRGFGPNFVNYKTGCTRLAAASDKVYQLHAQGRWFSPGTPASSTSQTGRHDIAEILLKVALNSKNSNTNVYTVAHVLNQENYPCPITINIEMTLLLTMLWKLFIQCFPSGLPVIERKWNKHQTWFNNVHVWDLILLVIVHVIWVLLNDWIRLNLEVLFVYLHCMMLCCIPSITMEWNCASIKICINFCSWGTFN
jgi:hypothetical protein